MATLAEQTATKIYHVTITHEDGERIREYVLGLFKDLEIAKSTVADEYEEPNIKWTHHEHTDRYTAVIDMWGVEYTAHITLEALY